MRALLAVMAAGVALSAQADEPAPSPKGPPPRFMIVSQVHADKGQFTCDYMVESPRMVMVEKIVEINGKKLATLETITQMVRETRSLVVNAAKARIASAGGQAIAAAELGKHLKPGQTVILSADGRNVDQTYLRVLQKDTVVIVMPQQEPATPLPKKVVVPERKVPPPKN